MRAFGESLVAYRPPIDTRVSVKCAKSRQTASRKKSLTSDAAPEMGHSLNLQ